MALAAVYTLRDLAAAHLVIRDRGTGEVALDPDTGEPAIRGGPYLPFVWGYVGGGRAFLWMWPISPRAASPTRCSARLVRGWT